MPLLVTLTFLFIPNYSGDELQRRKVNKSIMV